MDDITKSAIVKAGGARAIARVLRITHQAVIQWPHVPAKHVLEVERLSGVSRYDLRPDIYGEPPPKRPTRRADHRPAA
jgi:DNA-binding transcriptional regulator YdaS (Cro superfamily)